MKHIETASDYAEYQRIVGNFFKREGINNLSGITDESGNTETDEFSWRPCECCRRSLGGARVHANGYNPETKGIQDYWICVDCEYYAEYGRLDDMTMMDLRDND